MNIAQKIANIEDDDCACILITLVLSHKHFYYYISKHNATSQCNFDTIILSHSFKMPSTFGRQRADPGYPEPAGTKCLSIQRFNDKA